MVIRNVHQGTAEWLKLRLGKVTGSTVADAVAVLKRKDGEAAVRQNLKAQIIAEILTGQATEHYVSSDMMRGAALEDEAREAYAVRHDVFVDQSWVR